MTFITRYFTYKPEISLLARLMFRFVADTPTECSYWYKILFYYYYWKSLTLVNSSLLREHGNYNLVR